MEKCGLTSKAQKNKGWDITDNAFENNKPIMGKITSKCKGGVIVEHIDTGSSMFVQDRKYLIFQ